MLPCFLASPLPRSIFGVLCSIMLASLAVAIAMSQTAQATLKIDDIKVGTGDAVKLYDVIEAEYTGTLLSGKVFDSNVAKNAPFRFQVGIGKVIKGWDVGFVGLKLNGERKLTIPPELGYGSHAMGEDIPANSTLVFSVKLLRIFPSAKITVEKEGKGSAIKVGQLLDCKLSIKSSNGMEMADPTKESRIQLGPRILPWINQSIGGIKIGEKRKVIIPYEMAFGEKGFPPTDQGVVKAGSKIPPKSDLTIEVEALKISG